MKNYIKLPLVLFVILIFASCNRGQLERQEQQIADLEQQNQQLREEANEKEAAMNEFFEGMLQIRENLTEIKIRQNLITEEARDQENLGQNVRMQIESDLAAINDLMEDNRRRLANLNRQLRNSNVRIEEFELMIADLTSDIENRDSEITRMRQNLEQMQQSNEVLASTIDLLEEEKGTMVEQLNTAWYVYGSERELREHAIIDRRGGLLGIGRTTVIRRNLNTEHFSRLDISEVDELEIPATNPNLLSPHPAESYSIEPNGEDGTSRLIIEDPEQFWSYTRFLVVGTD
jgi:cell division protein FtsB